MKLDSYTDQEKLVGLMMDEMKVKSGLVFSKRTDRLVGFVNLGSINCDLEALQSFLVESHWSKRQDQSWQEVCLCS